MARHHLLSFGAVVAASVLACSGGRSQAPGTSADAGTFADAGTSADAGIPPDPAAEAFCNKAISLLAARMTVCMDVPHQAEKSLSMLYGDSGECQMLGKAVSAKRLKHDASKEQSCLSAIPTASCGDAFGDDLSVARGLAAVPECAQALSGRVANDGDCFFDIECPANSRCASPDLDACTGKCTPRAPRGGSCNSVGDCAAGLRCPNETCELPKNSGSCTFTEECADGYTCQGDPSICTAHTAPPAKKPGQPCTYGEFECQDYTACIRNDADAGTCVLWPGAGGACDSNTSNDEYVGCLAGTCVDGTCVDLLAVGSSCTSDSQCSSEICSDGVCGISETAQTCSESLGSEVVPVRGERLREPKASLTSPPSGR